MRNILLVVDYQNDFVDPKGSLYVKGAEKLVDFINERIQNPNYTDVWACQDCHPRFHCSFASSYIETPKPFSYVDLEKGKLQQVWPDHCVRGSSGMDFYPGLITDNFDVIIRKGKKRFVDSYSAFFDNDGNPTELSHLLSTGDNIDIVGVAGDFCVFACARDARKLHAHVSVLKRGIAYVDPESEKKITDVYRTEIITYQ